MQRLRNLKKKSSFLKTLGRQYKEKGMLKGEWLEKLPAGQLEAPGTQSKVGRMLPALSIACKRNASISRVPALPSQLQPASGCNLILLI
jgi:hypothetical protein